MVNLFWRHRLSVVAGGIFVLVLITILVISAQNRKSQKYSTPDLIQLAFVKGEITEEERLLYLAYALHDQDKLPARFHSNYPWGGTLIFLELRQAVISKTVMCKLSTFTQSELRQILREGATCE